MARLEMGKSNRRSLAITQVGGTTIRVRTEKLKGGRFLGTSPDVPGLVAEGPSVAGTVEIAQGLARKIAESCLENGDPLPAIFRKKSRPTRKYKVPIPVS